MSALSWLLPLGGISLVMLLSGDDAEAAPGPTGPAGYNPGSGGGGAPGGGGGAGPLPAPPPTPPPSASPGGGGALPPGRLSPEALATVTEVRSVDGAPVRYFRAEVADGVLDELRGRGLQPVAAPASLQGKASLYGVVPAKHSPLNAYQALATAASTTGVAVVGNHIMAAPEAPGRVVAMVPRTLLGEVARPSSDWAVLLDPAEAGGGGRGPAPSPGAPPGPPPPPQGGGGAPGPPGGGAAPPGPPPAPPLGPPPGAPPAGGGGMPPSLPGGLPPWGGSPQVPGMPSIPFPPLGPPSAPPSIPGPMPPGPMPPGPPGPPSQSGGGGGMLPPGGVQDLDGHLPAALRREIESMLADDSIAPAALEQAADRFASKYPVAAKRLRERADELRELQRLEAVRRGGSPFTVRMGDIPSRLALHYTGDGNRWRELPAVNQHRNMRIVTRSGVTNLEPWQGEVLLPLSWEAWRKSVPPVASGSAQSRSEQAADSRLSSAESKRPQHV